MDEPTASEPGAPGAGAEASAGGESAAGAPAEPTFALVGKRSDVSLLPAGLRHPGSSRRGNPVLTPYSQITHLASSERALWLGARRSVYVLQRKSFMDPQAPEHLVRALLERIAAQPGGAAQLAAMTQIEETARLPGEPRATRVAIGLCFAVYLLQLLGSTAVHEVSFFQPALFADGDWWRVVTANLAHANFVHLLLNLFALLAIGSLVERAFGSARSVVIMVASGLGSMFASGLATPVPVVGVSGVVSGLFGALLWLELRFGAQLPAWWRVPRRALFWVLAGMALLSLLPFVAGAAHLGGGVVGLAVAAGLSFRTLRSRPSPATVRGLAAAGVAFCALAGGTAAYQVLASDDYLTEHRIRIANLAVGPEALNNTAWLIAIDANATPELLEVALDMAQRAVAETNRETPAFLDTLAEVHFRLGNAEQAIRIIDEAIAQDPGRDYYREQRKRFTGEREGGPPADGFLPDWTPGADDALPEDGIQV